MSDGEKFIWFFFCLFLSLFTLVHVAATLGSALEDSKLKAAC